MTINWDIVFAAANLHPSPTPSPVRYILIIQSNVESGQKMIQFNIQFKIQSWIFNSKFYSRNWTKVIQNANLMISLSNIDLFVRKCNKIPFPPNKFPYWCNLCVMSQLIYVSVTYILKAGFRGFRNPQIIWNFLHKDWLRTWKPSV